MSQRRIVVFSNANGQREILENSTHTTWGELKAELSDKGFLVDRLEAVVRGTRATLKLDDAVLPETEFTLILVEKEMKSGAKSPFNSMSIAELKAEARKIGGIKIQQPKAELIKALKKASKKAAKAKATPAKKAEAKCEAKCEDTCKKACTEITPAEAKQKIEAIIEKAKVDVISTLESIKEGIDLFAGLEEEAKAIQAEIKK